MKNKIMVLTLYWHTHISTTSKRSCIQNSEVRSGFDIQKQMKTFFNVTMQRAMAKQMVRFDRLVVQQIPRFRTLRALEYVAVHLQGSVATKPPNRQTQRQRDNREKERARERCFHFCFFYFQNIIVPRGENTELEP